MRVAHGPRPAFGSNAYGRASDRCIGLGDEGRGGANPEEGELLLEVAAHELAAVVVPQGETGGDPLVVASEVGAHALAEWLEGPTLALGRCGGYGGRGSGRCNM